jgi:osmotically-inducible protein OsmY
MIAKRFLFGAAIGAAAAYFLDPDNGARRRNTTRDRLSSKARHGAEEVQRKADYAQGVAQGVAHKAKEAVPSPDGQEREYDDTTLARKVESEIFRDADAPKGDVNINVEDGVVYLRGQVKNNEIIEELEKQARKVDGVKDVQNLLHQPGTPAPTKS